MGAQVRTDSTLVAVGFALLTSPKLNLGDLALDHSKVLNFLWRVEAGYLNNPYHNHLHGADVAQTSVYMMLSGPLGDLLEDWQRLVVTPPPDSLPFSKSATLRCR